jgi:predicted DNA-binding transcriptional regulator YafY
MATLQDMGIDIAGEAGVGYMLKPGSLLPPLSFTEDEIYALVIGAQWVSRQSDDVLSLSVANALAKINAVIPPDMRPILSDDTVYIGPTEKSLAPLNVSEIRSAVREQRKLGITLSADNLPSGEQVVWPIMLGLVEGKRFIAAKCEMDNRIRLINIASIASAKVLAERYPGSRRQMLREWKTQENLPCNS